MTLQQLFDFLSRNPYWPIGFFTIIPLLAYSLHFTKRYKRLKTPYREIYSVLLFTSAIPGLLAFVLNAYFFLFERQSILDMNLSTQVLPILSFVVTVLIIKRQVEIDEIPGFGKFSSLIVMIFVAFTIMWLLDRTRIVFIAFSYMPFHYVLGIFIALLLAIRVGWKKFIK